MSMGDAFDPLHTTHKLSIIWRLQILPPLFCNESGVSHLVVIAWDYDHLWLLLYDP